MVLAYIEYTSWWKVEGKANKQQNSQVVPFVVKKIVLNHGRESARVTFGRVVGEGFSQKLAWKLRRGWKEGAKKDRSGEWFSWQKELAVQRPCGRPKV